MKCSYGFKEWNLVQMKMKKSQEKMEDIDEGDENQKVVLVEEKNPNVKSVERWKRLIMTLLKGTSMD